MAQKVAPSSIILTCATHNVCAEYTTITVIAFDLKVFCI